jgi:hypothetical protein
MGRQKRKQSIEISAAEALELHNLVEESKLGVQIKSIIRDLYYFEGESQITIINKNLSCLNARKD